MWPVVAAASAGLAVVLRVRVRNLARICDETLIDLEEAEDELGVLNKQNGVLMEQVKEQTKIIAEVSGVEVDGDRVSPPSPTSSSRHGTPNLFFSCFCF